VTLDPHAARFLDMVGAADRPGGTTPNLGAYRNSYDRLAGLAEPTDPRLCATSDLIVDTPFGGVPIRLYAPSEAGARPLPMVVWIHGGGWIAGGLHSCDPLCRSLAIESGCRIAAVDYRLAPEHPFPDGLDDCRAAVLHLWQSVEQLGSSRDHFAIGADSAGAHLAAGFLPALVDAGVRFKLGFFLCPVVDPFGDWPSRKEFASGYLLEETAMSDFLRFYGDNLDPDDERLSPLRSRKLQTYPDVIIHTAACDPVRDEGEAWAHALTNAGVFARTTRHQGLIHNFFGLTAVIPQARRALRDIGASLRHGMA
jgi:acetyl esterase